VTSLDLEPVKISYRRMRWTETIPGAQWECGPIVVMVFSREDGRQNWGTFYEGKMICRPWGYNQASDARFAAPHLGPVRKLREATP